MSSIKVPIDIAKLGGDSVDADAKILAERSGGCIVEIADVPAAVDWIEDFEFIYAQRQHDSTLKAIRKATDEELKRFRVPVWIQGEEAPICCGQAMHFVAQIDDNAICAERPRDAKLWWHDAASFYVFTCSECLAVQAVGQQF